MGDKVKWECKACGDQAGFGAIACSVEISGIIKEPCECVLKSTIDPVWEKENTKLKDALEKLEKGQHFFGPEETVFGGSYIEIREAEKIFIEALREE